MVDDQLETALEHVDEAHGTGGAVEYVVLLDFDHGQVAALGVELIPQPGQVLLLGEQLLAGTQPRLPGSDPGKAHHGLLSFAAWSGCPGHISYDQIASPKSSR